MFTMPVSIFGPDAGDKNWFRGGQLISLDYNLSPAHSFDGISQVVSIPYGITTEETVNLIATSTPINIIGFEAVDAIIGEVLRVLDYGVSSESDKHFGVDAPLSVQYSLAPYAIFSTPSTHVIPIPA